MKFSAAASCSSLGEDTLKFPLFRTIAPISNHGVCQWWQLLQFVKRAWTRSWSAVLKVMTFCRFQLRNCPFLEKRGIHFSSKDVYSPSISLSPHPLPKHVFRSGARVQFSCDTIRAFNNGIKIRENRGLWTGYQCSDPSVSFSLDRFTLHFWPRLRR